jgi:hypothetical protein
MPTNPGFAHGLISALDFSPCLLQLFDVLLK